MIPSSSCYSSAYIHMISLSSATEIKCPDWVINTEESHPRPSLSRHDNDFSVRLENHEKERKSADNMNIFRVLMPLED